MLWTVVKTCAVGSSLRAELKGSCQGVVVRQLRHAAKEEGDLHTQLCCVYSTVRCVASVHLLNYPVHIDNCNTCCMFLRLLLPLPSLDHIWDVMLVRRKGNIKKTVSLLQYCVPSCGAQSSSSHMRVLNHNWSATKQRPHPQSVAEISRHSVLSGDRIRQCETSLHSGTSSSHRSVDCIGLWSCLV